MRFVIRVNLIQNEFMWLYKISIVKIIDDQYKFWLIFLIKINVFNNNVNNVEKRLIKSFNDLILFEVFKMNKFSRDVIINTMNIKVKIFIFVIIINSKTFNNNIFVLIFNLITFKSKKDFIFIFNDFNLKAFILIVNENNKIFIVKTIAKNDEIVNIVIN